MWLYRQSYCRTFKNAGHRVIVIDRIPRPHTLAGIDEFIQSDFSSEESLVALHLIDPDVIIHCAATSLVGPSVNNLAEYYANNVIASAKLINTWKVLPKRPVFMFSSSAAVYGNNGDCLEGQLMSPINPYGSTKAVIEQMLDDYVKAYSGLEAISFRYFNAAGAWPDTFDLG